MQTAQIPLKLDEDGNPIHPQKLDEDGNPIPSSGNTILSGPVGPISAPVTGSGRGSGPGPVGSQVMPQEPVRDSGPAPNGFLANLGSRTLDSVKDLGSFINESTKTPSALGHAIVGMGKSVANSMNEVGHGLFGDFDNTELLHDPKEAIHGALGLVGANPDRTISDFQSGNYGATLGDLAIPAAGMLAGMRGKLSNLAEPKSIIDSPALPHDLNAPVEYPQSGEGPFMSGPGVNGEVSDIPQGMSPGAQASSRQPTTWQSIRDRLKNQEEPIKPTDVTPDEVPDGIKSLVEDGNNIPEGPKKDNKWGSIQDNLKSLMMAGGLYAPGAHGRGMITHGAYWNAMNDMFRAYGSERAEQLVNESIIDHPSGYFQSTYEPAFNETTGKPIIDRETGLQKQKKIPAIAKDLKLFGINTTDQLPNLPTNNLVTRIVPGAKQGSRAYRAFVNKAKSDLFVQLADQAKREGRLTPDLADQISDIVNISSGSGNFGKMRGSEFEKNINGAMKSLFFAPSLDLARIQQYKRAFGSLINYTNTDPIVRAEAWRSLLGTVGTGLVLNQVSSQMGITPVNYLSALGAVGKMGYQFVTGTKTNENGKTYNLANPKFGGQNRDDIITSFLASRLNVIPDLIYEYGRSRPADRTPENVTKFVAGKISPFILQDIYKAYKMNPLLPIPAAGLSVFGNPTPHEPGGR